MRISTIPKWILIISILGLPMMWLVTLMMPFRAMMLLPDIATGLTLAVPCSLAALCCAQTYQLGRLRWLMLSGIIAAAVSFVGWLLVIWLDAMLIADEIILFVAQSVGTISAWAGLCMVLALLMRYRMKPTWSYAVRLPTLVVTVVLISGIVATIWAFESIWSDEDLFVLNFVLPLSGLMMCGTLLTMVLSRAHHLLGEPDEQANVPRLNFTLWCPRCEVKQSFQTGGGSCHACGLSIKVTQP